MTTRSGADPIGRAGSLSRLPLLGLRAPIATFALLVAIGAALAIRDTSTWGTTYAGAAPQAAIADLAAGLGLIAAGLLVGADRSGRSFGALLMLAGAAWLSGELVGWQGVSMHVRMVATTGTALLGVMIVHIVVAAPRGRDLPRSARWAIGAGYVASAGLGLTIVALRDPLTDQGCWNLCSPNPLLLASVPGLEDMLSWAVVGLGVGTGVLTAVAAWRRLAGANRHDLRSLAPVLVPAIAAGVAGAACWLVPAWRSAEGPTDEVAMALHQVWAWCLSALAAGVIVVTVRARRVRGAIRELGATDAHGRSRSAAAVLREATGDPSLQVAYPRADGTQRVRADGNRIDALPGRSREVTRVTRAGALIAVIDHDPTVISAAELADQLGPTARLALENERLDAEVLAQVEELRGSRSRIIAAGDAERRRRERDLHDGAQQRLLALTYELRTARAAADGRDPGAIADHLDAAIEAVRAAHDELRELAHGLFPAMLRDAGLARALEALVDRAPIPVRADTEEVGRCETTAEMTVYVIADELVRAAVDGGATRARLRVSCEAGRLLLDVTHDGHATIGSMDQCDDRAAAAGGSLEMRTTAGREVLFHLEVPCESS